MSELRAEQIGALSAGEASSELGRHSDSVERTGAYRENRPAPGDLDFGLKVVRRRDRAFSREIWIGARVTRDRYLGP